MVPPGTPLVHSGVRTLYLRREFVCARGAHVWMQLCLRLQTGVAARGEPRALLYQCLQYSHQIGFLIEYGDSCYFCGVDDLPVSGNPALGNRSM